MVVQAYPSPWNESASQAPYAVRAITEGLRHELGGPVRTTLVSLGAADSEPKLGSSHPASEQAVGEFYRLAIPADSLARAIAYAIEQPADVDINQVVLRPTIQEF